MLQPTRLDTTNGPIVAGTQLSPNLFVGRVKAAALFQIAPDPRDTEDKKKVSTSRDLQTLLEVREDVQRLFVGQKEKNVPSYARYIVDLFEEAVDGITPPIILFSEVQLETEVATNGLGFVQVPYGRRLIAIDGETQLAARFEAAQINPKTIDEFVAIYICHGRDKEWARQAFHDLNVLGVRPNAALSIGMDARDPLTRVAREVERGVPFFKDRVNKVRRQLGRADTDVVTISGLRGACVTLTEGIGGVRHGTRPVHVSDDRIAQVEATAVDWFLALTGLLGTSMEDRDAKIASAPSVLAALGAMGHELLEIGSVPRRKAKMDEQLAKLKDVNWSRGRHWEGIAGKFTPKGKFSIGGSKETAYAVYEALNDPHATGYGKVRM